MDLAKHSVAPCKGIHDSLGFWIPHCGFRIPATGFRIPAQWLPDYQKGWIPMFFFLLDSGFQSLAGFRIPKPRKRKIRGFWNSDSHTRGERWLYHLRRLPIKLNHIKSNQIASLCPTREKRFSLLIGSTRE